MSGQSPRIAHAGTLLAGMRAPTPVPAAELEAPAGMLIDDLLWWTAALKKARAEAS